MICKHCGASMEDGQTVCPLCGMGREQPEGLQEEAAGTAMPEGQTAEPEAAEQPESGTAEQDAVPEQEEPPAAPKRGKAAGWLLGALIVVALAALILLILAVSDKHRDEAVPSPDVTDVTNVDAEGNFVEHTYTKADDALAEGDASAVVASCGGAELTNSLLSFYYWEHFINFMNTYGSYASMMNLDLSQPLGQQMYDETHTWEDFFLQRAVEAFWQNSAVAAAAGEAGFTLDEASQSVVDSLEESLTAGAESGGFASADAYLQSLYGSFANAADYTAFAESTLLNNTYLAELFDGIPCEEEDVIAYFDAHAEEFAAQGLSRDDPNMVNVRHILIQPAADQDAETDENGSPVLTEQNWTDAEIKAEELLDLWKSGEATEASFAELAGEHSEDPGSVSNGGLYEEVRPGQMVTAFNDWCFDGARQPGDTGIVKTDYGYHIMYYVGQCDHAYWYQVAEQQYLYERQQALVQELLDASPITVDYSKAVLAESGFLQ